MPCFNQALPFFIVPLGIFILLSGTSGRIAGKIIKSVGKQADSVIAFCIECVKRIKSRLCTALFIYPIYISPLCRQ